LRGEKDEEKDRGELNNNPNKPHLLPCQKFSAKKDLQGNKKGRPLIYPEHLILTLLAIKQVYGLLTDKFLCL
jgi:hypothetical protein